MYGRDAKGPTAVLKSVSRVKSEYGSNGTLLNMNLLGVSSYLQVVLKGAILVVAIWLDNRKEQ